jgi:iron complex transport system substrate-binding protein
MGGGYCDDDLVRLVRVRKTKGAAFRIAVLLLIVTACEQEDSTRSDSQNYHERDTSTAMRVVTLAPNLAELMFAAQAGDQLVGVSAFTDYPPAAAGLPIVGDSFLVDQERLALLRPDLLLAWENGTRGHVIDQVRTAGFRVEVIRTNSLDDVATAIETIGQLTGNFQPARIAAALYRQQVQALAERYSGAAPVRVFYQISSRPLYTINGAHYISELLALCGGRNIFQDLGELAPMVDVEAVISRNPEAMLAAADSTLAAFDVWDPWPDLAANRYGNRFFIPAAEIGRATPRLVAAGEAVCEALAEARRNRQARMNLD